MSQVRRFDHIGITVADLDTVTALRLFRSLPVTLAWSCGSLSRIQLGLHRATAVPAVLRTALVATMPPHALKAREAPRSDWV